MGKGLRSLWSGLTGDSESEEGGVAGLLDNVFDFGSNSEKAATGTSADGGGGLSGFLDMLGLRGDSDTSEGIAAPTPQPGGQQQETPWWANKTSEETQKEAQARADTQRKDALARGSQQGNDAQVQALDSAIAIIQGQMDGATGAKAAALQKVLDENKARRDALSGN
jgi:hypothetical protein